MASTTPSPVSHLPGPLNINYDSDDDDMQVDSDDARRNTNFKETDPDADGESVDDDASPPPSTVNIAGPSLSHHHIHSVRFILYPRPLRSQCRVLSRT
jgi:chromodomain-helicase-DNA-binding protein 1